jgi:GATA zinc finger
VKNGQSAVCRTFLSSARVQDVCAPNEQRQQQNRPRMTEVDRSYDEKRSSQPREDQSRTVSDSQPPSDGKGNVQTFRRASPRRRSPGQGSPSTHGPTSSRAGQIVKGGPCVECGATQSVLFRKSIDGLPLCNACGLRYQRRLGKHTTSKGAQAAPSAADGEPSPAPTPVAGSPTNSGRAARPVPRSRRKAAGSPSGEGGKEGGAKQPTRRRLPAEGQQCFFCYTTHSPQWRYVGVHLACNACALQRKRRAVRTSSDAKVRLPPAFMCSASPRACMHKRSCLLHPRGQPVLCPRLGDAAQARGTVCGCRRQAPARLR